MRKVGIDSLSYYVPSLYVDIEELAIKRKIVPDKLIKGLGLKKMATPDFDEDSASIAATTDEHEEGSYDYKYTELKDDSK